MHLGLFREPVGTLVGGGDGHLTLVTCTGGRAGARPAQGTYFLQQKGAGGSEGRACQRGHVRRRLPHTCTGALGQSRPRGQDSPCEGPSQPFLRRSSQSPDQPSGRCAATALVSVRKGTKVICPRSPSWGQMDNTAAEAGPSAPPHQAACLLCRVFINSPGS